MSCQIKVSANICDIAAIRRCLYPLDDDRGSDFWLQNCLMSVSPTGELIILANKNKIVVLTAKWDSNAVLNQYHISFSGSLDDPTDNITAVLCLPIASQSKSSQVGPDWTCLAIGFQSGYVKFYTDNCTLLFSERLHDEKVVNIKCQSQNTHLDSTSELRPEEIYIQYPSCVCMYQGNQFFPALRNFRSQLARVQAKGDNFDTTAPFLCPKKWGFSDQSTVNDMTVVGCSSVNTFDHLLTASICGGFDAKYRAVAPSNTQVIGVGVRPYVAFHYAIEGVAQPVLSDVAKAVANKLKSALPGWLVGSKPEEKPQAPTIQPIEPMACRFGLCDSRRNGDSVTISPDKKLSVVTDTLGRITLIDNRKGIAVRLWKGYRGAQCSFLQVPDEEKIKQKGSKKQRVATFLIMYIPKKGMIEIWALQQGPKIVTFSASKTSRLVYNNYSLLGFGNTLSKSKHGYHFGCLFIDNDGQIKDILVPFHFSLPEKNSKRTRDLHLIKKLKSFLKSEDYNLEELCNQVGHVCSELKTNVLRQQCFEMLLASRYMQPKATLTMAETFLEKLSEYCEEKATDESLDEIKNLLVVNQVVKILVEFYMYLENMDLDEKNGNVPLKTEINTSENGNGTSMASSGNDNVSTKIKGETSKNENAGPKNDNATSKIDDAIVKNDNDEKTKETSSDETKTSDAKATLDTSLAITEKEMTNLQKLLDLSTLDDRKISEPKVSFQFEKKTVFTEYLQAFDLNVDNSKISLKTEIPDDKLYRISEMIYQNFLNSKRDDISSLNEAMIKSNIRTIDFVRMLLCYWINRPLHINMNLTKEMHNFSKILEAICNTTSKDQICPEFNTISPFWTEIRHYLTTSARPFPALTAAILCRSISQKIEQEVEQQCSITSLDDENKDIWENLTQENCQWTLLIGKLEDVSLLNIIISNKPTFECCTLPKLHYDRTVISLNHILNKGRGSISELVAQWLATGGVDPSFIAATDLYESPLDNEEPKNMNIDHQKGEKCDQNPKKMEAKSCENDSYDPYVSDLKGESPIVSPTTSPKSKNPKVSSNSVDTQSVSSIVFNQGDQGNPQSSTDFDAQSVLNDPNYESLITLRNQFPYSMESSAVLANMCWEYALNWKRDIKNFDYLEASLKCLDYISNIFIKQGLFNLMWTTHIRETFESVCKLINKVGKVPKEVLCKQDTNLSDAQIPIYIQICSEFLDKFLDTVQQSYSAQKGVLKFENLWENGGVPLTELALQQNEINSTLLHMHYQLSIVIQMMTTFNVKQIKPIANLFDSSTLNLFFTDLTHKIEISTHSSEKKLQTSRTQFLTKVITASIETVQLSPSSKSSLYTQDHVNWMSKCTLLANEWGVDTDTLRRHQVVQIFTNGFNDFGEEILPSVRNTEKLGLELLTIACKQLKQILVSSQDYTSKIVALSPSLQQYVLNLDSDWVANGTIDSVTHLAEHIVRFLPETSNHSVYAGLLLEACLTLQEMEN